MADTEITVAVAELSDVDQGLLRATAAAIQHARAPSTLAAYAGDWERFENWCERRRMNALPAAPAAVALFLTSLSRNGRKVATIERHAAAIGFFHERAGHASPRRTHLVRETLAGLRRQLGAAPVEKDALVVDSLTSAVHCLPKDLRGLRDRALLLLGFGGAFRRSELVSLRVEDLTFVREGLRVHLRVSKTDQEGLGRTVPVRRGEHVETCPARAVRAWLEAARITTGHVFRAVDRHGCVAAGPLCDATVARVVKASVARIGLDSSSFAGHSLRAGFVTSAARAGAHEFAIRRVTGHKSVHVLARYVREANAFDGHPADRIGL